MIDLPESAAEVDSRAKTDVRRTLTGSNPFLPNSWLGAIVTAFANRIFDFYIQLNALLLEMFWNTSSDPYLKTQASWFGIETLAATQSSGDIVLTGVVGSSVGANVEWKYSDGSRYLSTTSVVIAANVANVTNLTRSGQTATAVTEFDHGLSSSVLVTQTGADQPEYNGVDLVIQVVNSNTYTYQVAGSPVTPATGAVVSSYSSVQQGVKSIDFGADTNRDPGDLLTISQPLAGVDNSVGVNYGGLGGGTDQEDIADLRKRFFFRVQNPVAHFNSSDIETEAKEVNGVTRVFVEPITPAVGQVTIYFMRDNDPDPIPTAPEIADVKEKILLITPANTSDADVIVRAPTPVPVDFTFISLVPDSATMRDAINANLNQFFSEATQVNTNVDEDAYRSTIFNTVDPATGDTVQTFGLSSPVGDVLVSVGGIAVLGSVVYP